MRLARAHIDTGPLSRPARATLVPRVAGPLEGELMSFVWRRGVDGFYRKTGQSRGSRCHVAVDPLRRRALVVAAAHHSFPVTELIEAVAG